MPYADASAQTVWAGLTNRNMGPEMLFTAPDTTTPPAETTITEKSQIFIDPRTTTKALASSLLNRRKHRPDFPTRISLPKQGGIDDEVLPSPPPTQALQSPLPEANKRFAGHTPLIPRALSPEPPEEVGEQVAEEPKVEEDNKVATPDLDEGLTGPLILPTNPVDGADDHIALDVLDHVLEKVAKDQDRFSKLKDAPEPTAAPAEEVEEEVPLSRKGSADSRQSTATEVVDGVRLKSPPLNFGVPYGQLSFGPPEQT